MLRARRRTMAAVLGVVALGLGLIAVSQVGVSLQPQSPPLRPEAQGPSEQAQLEEASEDRLRVEIELLKLINELGLTREQLQTLQRIVSDLRAKRQAIVQAQLEMRDFLLAYAGPPEGLAEALEPYEGRVEEARRAFRDALRRSIEQLKDLLTLRQGEVLRDFLRERFGRFSLELELEDRPRRGGMPRRPIWIDPDPEGAWRELEPEFERAWREAREHLRAFREKLQAWLERLDRDLEPELKGGIQLKLERGPRDRASGQRCWRIWFQKDPFKQAVELRACPPEFWLQELGLKPAPMRYPFALEPERGWLERFLIEHLERLDALLRAKLEALEPPPSMQI